MSGTWRPVASSGGDGYSSALGLTKEHKKKYVDGVLNYKFDVERLPNGVLQIKSNSPWTPGGVLNIKSGQSFTYEFPEAGTIEVKMERSI